MNVLALTDDWNQVLQNGKVCLFLFVDWSLQARASRKRIQEAEQQFATDPSLQGIHWWMVAMSKSTKGYDVSNLSGNFESVHIALDVQVQNDQIRLAFLGKSYHF